MFTAGIERISDAKIVVDGKYYSCRNTMMGIDMALWAAADILDIEAAEKAAERIVYSWSEDPEKDIYI